MIRGDLEQGAARDELVTDGRVEKTAQSGTSLFALYDECY
jgi:hypothetical protein